MQTVSKAYKEMMRRKWRNTRTYLRVTIGMINQQAQSTVFIPDPERYTYFSDLKKPMDNYQVRELYVTCDQNYTLVDGSMFFLPRTAEDAVLNQGIVTDELLGDIEFRFPKAYDIKGLTIEFGRTYPVIFSIISDNRTVEVQDNEAGRFVTGEIFEGATFLRIVPKKMVNGQSRLRIHQITMGIGIYFDSRKILSATKKEHISPISEELPTIDFDLTAANRERDFDIENEDSPIHFLEVGQDVEVLFGQELDDGSVEWMPGVALQLKDWSADDDKVDFRACDRFDSMNGIYHRGRYYPAGISLYDLAVDVFEDAGIDSRDYVLDSYLKKVMVANPMPAVSHGEALQLIANAGRGIIFQDRTGRIFLRSSFIPDMAAQATDETYFSNAAAVLDGTAKTDYALTGQGSTAVDGSFVFLPREDAAQDLLPMGYVSEVVADADGNFTVNPTVEIVLEASYRCFGLSLQFGCCCPQEIVFYSYLDGVLQEDFTVGDLTEFYILSHEFPLFDRLVLEFTRGQPHNRVVLENISFGDSTDYVLEYGVELLKTPKGTQPEKVKELQMMRTLYSQSKEEAKELLREAVEVSDGEQRTFYFTNAAYGLSVALAEPASGQSVEILDSGAFYVTLQFVGVSETVEVVISGKEYAVTQAKVSRQLNAEGSMEVWENPLVSDIDHARDLAEWIGDYLRADREYDLTYRGEPRLDANDLAFLENKYVPDLLVRIYDHTLKYNGGLSGTIKARRDMSNVAAAKNRLAGGTRRNL